MKKFKKIIVTFLLVLCSFFLVACGEMKVFVNYGSSQMELSVGKNDADEIKEKISKLEKDGYEVEGVYTDAAYTQKWNGEDVSKNMKLYVKWIGKEYKVTYNANGGEGTMADQTIRYNESAVLTGNAYTRTGYTFKGWATSASANAANFLNLANYTMTAKGITLYAVWEANPYSVSFNANGGNGTMQSQTIRYNQTAMLSANTFQRDGYEFIGWNTEANGSGTAYENLEEYTMGNGAVTLYAQWEIEKYNIVIKNGTETLLELNNVTFGTNISDHPDYQNVQNLITVPTGMVFDGLYLITDTDFENKFTTNFDVIDFGNNNQTFELIVRIVDQEGVVAINYNGADGGNAVTQLNTVYGDALTDLPTPTKTGYKFVGWYTVSTNPADDNFDATKLTTSRVVTNQTVWTGNITSVNALWALETYNLTLSDDGGNWNDDTRPTTVSLNNTTTISGLNKKGYKYLGFEVMQDMIVGGNFVAEGTILELEADNTTILPANTFVLSGNSFELKAKFEIQTHSVTFKVANGAGGYNDLLVINGNSFINVEDATNYNYDTIYTNMAKQGFAFDGWYTSNTNFIEANRFNNKVDGEDLIVYANYVEVLNKPTNINMLQNSTIVTWDAVAGADYYMVSIDGGSPQKTAVNSFDTGILTTTKDDYVIEIEACSDYVGVLNEKINSGYVTYNFSRAENLVNSILRIDDGHGNVEKYVVFTGNTYTWQSSEYKVEIKDLSEDGVATVNYAEEAEKTSSTIAVGNKMGTFKFVINYNNEIPDQEFNVQVVHDVQTIAYGESYSNYLNQIDEKTSSFLNTEDSNSYLVGTANGFVVDFVLTKGDTEYSEFDRTSDVLSYSYQVKDGGEYRDATAEEIPERRDDGKLYFAAINAGKEYKVTVEYAYSKQVTDLNPTGKLTRDFEIKLNTGINVYTHNELKANFADASVSEINILRNIVPELASDQVQADGSPINVRENRIFNSDDTESNNATEGTERKTDGNIYKRAFNSTKYLNEKIVVNGNFCKIDASKMKLVNPDYSTRTSNGTHNQTDHIDISGQDYVLLRPHVGVFMYRNPFGEGATFNNLEVIGNKPTGELGVDPTDANAYKDAVIKRLTEESGSYSAFYIDNGKTTINNVIMYNLHHGVRADGATKSFVEGVDLTNKENWGVNGSIPNNCKVECNYMIVHDVYQNGVYSWEGKEVKVYNSKLYYLNGPAVQVSNEGTVTAPLIVIDKHTKVDNFLTGTETWFSLWGLSTLAGQLKAMLQPVMQNMGASVLGTANGNEATNLIFIFEPMTKLTSGVLEDGTYVENEAKACCCTVYYGGEKAIIEGETLSTGVKTFRSSDHFASGDMRISGGMHAFGVTPFATTQEFSIAALATQTILLDQTKQELAIKYVLGLATWETVSTATTINVPNMGALSLAQLGMKEEWYKAVTEAFFEYGVVREAVITAISQGATSENVAGAYETSVIPGIANALGFEAGTVVAGDEQNPITFGDILKAKVTLQHIIDICKIHESDNAELISFNTIKADAYANAKAQEKSDSEAETAAGTAVVMFMLLKFVDSANLDKQAVEIVMPKVVTTEENYSPQIIYLEYGFKDQPNW